jgi:glutaconate CoA-transferase subunit A
LKYRDDWKVIDSPSVLKTRSVLLPAIKPDVALLHAPMAVTASAMSGSAAARARRQWAHRRGEDRSNRGKIYDGNLLDDTDVRGRHASGFYVESIVVAERGAWPPWACRIFTVGR